MAPAALRYLRANGYQFNLPSYFCASSKESIAHMKALDQIIVARFKEKVSERLALRQIILFGSRAKGDADPDSDMDVIVVLEDPVDRQAEDWVSECAWQAGFEHGVVVAPITFGRKEWEEGPERYSLLALAAERDGVTL
jgi:hypothetical protein